MVICFAIKLNENVRQLLWFLFRVPTWVTFAKQAQRPFAVEFCAFLMSRLNMWPTSQCGQISQRAVQFSCVFEPGEL